MHLHDGVVDVVDLVLDGLDQRAEDVGDVVDERVRDPVRAEDEVVAQLADAAPHVGRVRRLREVEGQHAGAEDDDVHVDGLQVVLAVAVLLEGAIVEEVVVAEQLDLLARLLHHDVLGRQRVDAERLRNHSHLRVRRRQHVQPPRRPRAVALGFLLLNRPFGRRRFRREARVGAGHVAAPFPAAAAAAAAAVAVLAVDAGIVMADVAGQGDLARRNTGCKTILFLGIRLLRVLQLRRVRDEQLAEAAARLHQLGDGLRVDGALELLVEVGEAVGGLVLLAAPARVLRPQAPADQDGLADLLDAELAAALLLLLAAPLLEHGQVRPLAPASPPALRPRAEPVLLGHQVRGEADVLLGRRGGGQGAAAAVAAGRELGDISCFRLQRRGRLRVGGRAGLPLLLLLRRRRRRRRRLELVAVDLDHGVADRRLAAGALGRARRRRAKVEVGARDDGVVVAHVGPAHGAARDGRGVVDIVVAAAVARGAAGRGGVAGRPARVVVM